MKDIEPKILAAKVYCLKGWVELTDPDELVDFFQKQLEENPFNILNFLPHRFPQNGFTGIWLLAESHLAIHSFIEKGWTYFELTSCNKVKSELFKQGLKKANYTLQLDSEMLEESAL